MYELLTGDHGGRYLEQGPNPRLTSMHPRRQGAGREGLRVQVESVSYTPTVLLAHRVIIRHGLFHIPKKEGGHDKCAHIIDQ
jgi:hypothetical protein